MKNFDTMNIERKNRFFNPYVGEKYEEGINGKRVLVVGASFYCNKTECKYFADCTDTTKKDSSKYNEICPPYSVKNQLLCDEPTYAMDWGLRTYANFAEGICDLVGVDRCEDVWKYLAFTNYVQFILPRNGETYRPTYRSDLSERDFLAFNETIVELQPDIVIVWGCVFNTRVRQENEYLVDEERLRNSDWYVCEVRLPEMDKNVTIINPYHPSSPAWYTDIERFRHYLAEELKK